MALTTLLAETGVAGTVGSSALVSTTVTSRQLQFNPKTGQGFSGTLIVEGSSAGSPGNSDWSQLAEVIFSAHTQNFVITMQTSIPWMRVRVTAGTLGAVSVYMA